MSAPLDDSLHNPFRKCPPLPEWIAGPLLRPGEQVTWVRGPHANPAWERYITHPGLTIVPLAIGGGLMLEERLFANNWSESASLIFTFTLVLLVGSVIAIALASGYFTRLVVTNQRIVLFQGHELIRQWSMDDLPRTLVRYRRLDSGQESRTVNLEALETMLGSASDQFADSKTLRSFGKQVDRIKAREDGPPPGSAPSGK